MMPTGMSRRQYVALLGAAGAAAARPPAFAAPTDDADRARRMQWWHQAKFGMFIHWGLYSVLGRHEWAMESEGIPVSEYQLLAQRFTPKPNAARDWARLARRAGMKYMVMTSKHHEGFCLFNSQLTNYCAPKQACGRDLVKEYFAAARGEGLHSGLYYSLMDWHHPDGARCLVDESARRRFVDYIHGHVREICSNYGKLDVLWYDVNWPLDAAGWESERMNQMVFQLQPDTIVNNRNGLPGDFSTPEQHITAEKGGRAWEACMTMNDSWGFHKNDDDWKTPKTVIRNLITCARQGGNYLLNIGPKPDGSIPEDSIRILTAVGKWMDKNGATIYGSQPCQVHGGNFWSATRKDNTLYAHLYFWPGETAALGGLRNKVLSARYLATGQPVKFVQDDFRVRLTGLPATPPDDPASVFALELDSEPRQDMTFVRKEKKRQGV